MRRLRLQLLRHSLLSQKLPLDLKLTEKATHSRAISSKGLTPGSVRAYATIWTATADGLSYLTLTLLSSLTPRTALSSTYPFKKERSHWT